TGTAGTPFDATVHNVGFLTENSMNLLQIRNGGYIDLGSIAGAAFNGGSFNDGTNPAGVGWTIEITFLQPDTTNYDLLSFYRGPLQTKDANALWAESYSGIIRHSPGTTNASTSNTHNISGKWIDVIYVCSGSWIDPWLNGVKDSGNAGNFAALQSGDYAPFLHNYIGNGMTDGKIYRVIITADRRGMDGSGTIKSTEKTEILNTLTALNTAVVTYDPNGGYWVSDSSTDPLVQNTTLTSQYSASIPAEPKKDGEVFMGWNTQADGTGDWIVPGALITAWNSAFYAIWSDVAYVYFIDGPDSYKGTQLTPMDTETVTIGETLAALPDAPVLAGYDFAGWWTQQVGGTEVTTDTIVDRVIYAYSHWTLKPEVKELVFELNSSNVLTGTYYDATDGAGNAIGTVTPIITGTPAIDTIHGDLRSLVLGNGSYIDLGREAAMMINQPFWTVNMYARIPAAEPVTDHLMTVMQNTGDLTKGVMWSEANNSAYGFAYRDRTNWSDSSTTSPAYSGSPGNAQTGNFVSLSYMRDGSGWAHDVLNATTQGDWGQSGSNLAESANCNPMNYFFLGRMPDGAVTTAAVEYYKIILRPEFPGPDQATYLAQYGDSITNTVNTLNFYPFVDAVTANVNNMNLSAINGNLSLPTSYNGITISWVSEHPEYLSNTGVVTQPEGLGDQTFNITATFTAGSLTEQSIFSVTVLDAAPIIVTSKLIDDFEVPGASIGSNATSYGYNYWQNNGSGGFTFDAGYTGSLCGKITYANSWTWWQGGRDFQSAPIDISGCTKITFWARCANSSLGGDGVHLMSGTSSSGRPEKIWDIPNGMTDTWQKYEFPLTDLPDGFDLTKITGWSIRNWDQVTFYVDDIYAE
ncbi:MAG: InlB B-repeat-containing protein, partial [Treponema sp.]|nr:InlB B-repeat-containing protein [Treponema sp.]